MQTKALTQLWDTTPQAVVNNELLLLIALAAHQPDEMSPSEHVPLNPNLIGARARLSGAKLIDKLTSLRKRGFIDLRYDGSSIVGYRVLDNQLTMTNMGDNAVPCAQILDLYHQYCDKLPRVKVFSDKRRKAVKQRWKEANDRQTLAWWVRFFTFVNNKCPFLTGTNDSGWRADFDFLMKAENMIKIIENKYVARDRRSA